MAMGNMDMMDMDMGSASLGGDITIINKAYARSYWYFVAAALVLFLIIRIINFVLYGSRLRRSRSHSVRFPTRPTNFCSQLWATLTAVCREMSYPQLYVPIRNLTWLTPPPMGHIFLLLLYWAAIIYIMFKDAVILDVNFMERLGYRNAWVTVTQVPLLYLLASRTNVIALITGTSYERLNWLHRWSARTILITTTVHGFCFFAGWVDSDIVGVELGMMDMVKYGFGAWGVLLWMNITSFKPLRSIAYEVFVIQHILAAVIFLWLVYVHVPVSARYNVWFAVAALCFDRVFRLGLLFWQNIKLRPNRSCCQGGQLVGHKTQLSPVGESIMVLTIKDVHFKWKAGQHLYLWLPRVAPFEAHPYTIASAHQTPETCICNSIQLVIRSHSGFSKRLGQFARKQEAMGKKQALTALIIGPYGNPPRWDIFETLVLISASTGASYTLPILESVLHSKKRSCTKRVDFLLTAKQGEEVGFYHERLHEAMEKAKSVGIELVVHIAVTGDGQLGTLGAVAFSSSSTSSTHEKNTFEDVKVSVNVEGIIQPLMGRSRMDLSETSSDSHIHHSASRPDVAEFIRTAVEATGGETGIVVCGGQSLVTTVRTNVAKLSDERAVHKGTGAQGIHLHVEEYCF
ncbi:ferric reductase like transmembrane component-domain-containing protein [Daldinia loculata]|uniref:ferric reductase like transmembrane component-domain-containing protein n=1 Tax=Daldinia loculata TaxID=103429 RepID=UPI0020C22556|nr:ferric reductase like transmembrane component-domain-containing protein [Daldinia loculata]KAI1644055.1 ferric reductase like transmembrane component-domain-containing protein [Daldinia loculata]